MVSLISSPLFSQVQCLKWLKVRRWKGFKRYRSQKHSGSLTEQGKICSRYEDANSQKSLLASLCQSVTQFHFVFSVQIWKNLFKTQWECEERCDIRHLLFVDRREPIRREVQDQVSAAPPLVRGGLWRGRILSRDHQFPRCWTPNSSWWAVGDLHGCLCHQCISF